MEEFERVFKWVENNLNVEYIEFCYEDLRKIMFGFKDGVFISFIGKFYRGVVIRVLVDGVWGFVLISDFINFEKKIEEVYKLVKVVV